MIVVGVDTSPEARAALRWAVDEARLRSTTVRAVYAWHPPLATGWRHIPAELLTPAAMHAAARALLDGVVDELVNGDLEVERVTIEGPTAECLVESAENAELLVVGTRHHRSVGSLVVGSVSAECVLRARCPVVVVHRGPTRDEQRVAP